MKGERPRGGRETKGVRKSENERHKVRETYLTGKLPLLDTVDASRIILWRNEINLISKYF